MNDLQNPPDVLANGSYHHTKCGWCEVYLLELVERSLVGFIIGADAQFLLEVGSIRPDLCSFLRSCTIWRGWAGFARRFRWRPRCWWSFVCPTAMEGSLACFVLIDAVSVEWEFAFLQLSLKKLITYLRIRNPIDVSWNHIFRKLIRGVRGRLIDDDHCDTCLPSPQMNFPHKQHHVGDEKCTRM